MSGIHRLVLPTRGWFPFSGGRPVAVWLMPDGSESMDPPSANGPDGHLQDVGHDWLWRPGFLKYTGVMHDPRKPIILLLETVDERS